jgi:hypothetical protein
MTTVKRALVRKRLIAVVAAALLGASTMGSSALARGGGGHGGGHGFGGEAMRWARAVWEGTASQWPMAATTTTAVGLLGASAIMAAYTDTPAITATVIPTTTLMTAINRG